MTAHGNATWTDDNIARLKELYASGLSSSQIGTRMGVTRNAVIGKLHRLKMMRGRTPAKLRPIKAKPAKPALPRQRFALRSIEAEIGHPNSPYERVLIRREVKAEPIEAPPQPRGDKPSLLDLGRHDCKWPYGDPRHKDFHFCGAPREGEGPYCLAHKKQATAVAGTGIKFDPEDNDLIRAKWNRGAGLPVLIKELGRPGAIIMRQAVVTLRLPRMAA